MGRQWQSPFGENIYCSLRWQPDNSFKQLSGLGLLTSLAIHSALKTLHPSLDIQIKWPNDLLWRDRKLCGSLIELQGKPNECFAVIIGIGLNVNTNTLTQPLSDKPCCSLYDILGQCQDRNGLIALIIVHLVSYLGRFISEDFQAFIREWDRLDYLRGKKIRVSQGSQIFEGQAAGVDHDGQLILEDEQGLRQFFSAGDTSIIKER